MACVIHKGSDNVFALSSNFCMVSIMVSIRIGNMADQVGFPPPSKYPFFANPAMPEVSSWDEDMLGLLLSKNIDFPVRKIHLLLHILVPLQASSFEHVLPFLGNI